MSTSPKQIAESVAELVRIPSVNPLHTGPVAEAHGPIGERALAEHLANRFESVGASEVVLHDAIDDRPNVYGFFPGHTERLVVLDVHTDTVTVEHMTDPPFDGRIEDGHVWGRGALDTKASLGVITALLDDWKRDGLRPDPTLLVVGSVAEEAGGLIGAAQFRPWADERGLEVDQLIVSEPTQLSPIHGHKGAVILMVTTQGESAHSSLPHLGRNAITAMAPVIAAFDAENQRLQQQQAATQLGNGTVSVTMINGGTGGNVIPASCQIVVGRRLVPDEDPDEVFDWLADIARNASPLPVEVKQPEGRIGDSKGAPAFYQSADSSLVRDLASWAGTEPSVAPFGTNALRYFEFANQMVVFGPGSIDDAHQATECVSIDDLATTADVLTKWLRPS